jgi:hypothetical protein
MLDPACLCLPSKRRRLTAEQSLDLYAFAAGPEKQSPTTAEQAPELPELLEQPPESSGLAEESSEQSTPEDQISQLNAQAEALKQTPDLSPAPERDSPSERPADPELSVSATRADQSPEVPSEQPTDLSTPTARDSHQLSSSSLLFENGALAVTTYSEATQARTTRSKARSESSGPGNEVSDGGHVTQVVPHVWRTTRSKRSALTASQSASSPLGTSSGLTTTKNRAEVAEDGVAERAAEAAENTAAESAAAENLVMDKAVSEKAVTEKASSEKAVTEKASVEREAAAEKAAAEKAAAEKAAAEKAAAEKAVAEKAAAEKAAVEREAAEKAAAEELALSADVKRKRRMMTLRSPYRLSLYFNFIVSVGGKILSFASFHLLMKLRQEPV